MIVEDRRGERAGIVVEDVEEVLTVETEQLESTWPPTPAPRSDRQARQRLVVLPNVDGLFDAGRRRGVIARPRSSS